MQKKYFSLIELLVVIGILGALCSLMLPGFGDAQEDAKKKVVMTEMREAQAAFRRFASDVMLKNNITKMEDILKFGIWPLMKKSHPNSTDSPHYDNYVSETGIGRRGPYLHKEWHIKIADDSPVDGGQTEVSSGDTVEIPVIKDPYGGYYRVICPALEESTGDDRKEKLRRMVLVCTGPDKNLDTPNTDLDDDDDIKCPADCDDKVVRLMPLATY